MNLLTPYRFLSSLPTAEGRLRYVKVCRTYFWNLVSHRSKEVLLGCKLEGGMRMRVSTLDQCISKQVFIHGAFEPFELGFIRKVVDPGMTVMDIGANIGVHALTLAQSVGPDGVVHAFEPSTAFDRLQENVALNAFSSRVRLNRCAVGQDEGTLTLTRCRPGMEAYTSKGAPMNINFAAGDSFDVPMISLDLYASRNNIQKIDFMKIDTEGSEEEVLRGAARLLADRAIRCIMFEINETCLTNCGTSPRNLIATVRRADFELHILGKNGDLTPCPDDIRDNWTTVIATIP